MKMILFFMTLITGIAMAGIYNPPIAPTTLTPDGSGSWNANGHAITNLPNGVSLTANPGTNGGLRVLKTVGTGGSNVFANVLDTGNIESLHPTTVYKADGITTKKSGSTFSVSDWIPHNLVDVYFQMLVHQGAAGRSMLDGTGYIYNDQNGILTGPGQSTNYVWGNVGYRNSISSTNIGGDGVSPVSQWKMNDNAATTEVVDSVGTNNGVAQQNTESLATSGKINGALNFNGSSDKIATTYSVNNWAFSFCAWVYITNTTGGLFCNSIFNNMRFNYDDFGIYGQGGDSWWGRVTSDPLPTNQWVHVVIVCPSNEYGTVYINGELRPAGSLSGSGGIYADSPFIIGVDEADGKYFSGDMDDVRVYPIALSSNEIATIYNAGSGTEIIGVGTNLYTTNSMSLVSTNKILDFVPTATWMSILVSGAGATTNDVKGYVSPDYGVNWYEATLTPQVTIDLSNTLFQGTAVYTNNTTGTNMIQKTWVSSNGVWKVLGVACPSN